MRLEGFFRVKGYVFVYVSELGDKSFWGRGQEFCFGCWRLYVFFCSGGARGVRARIEGWSGENLSAHKMEIPLQGLWSHSDLDLMVRDGIYLVGRSSFNRFKMLQG